MLELDDGKWPQPEGMTARAELEIKVRRKDGRYRWRI